MEKKSFAFDWMMTLISLVAVILMLIFIPAWFWVGLPFLLTYLVKAFDSI